mgnify:CR=1 FL=1
MLRAGRAHCSGGDGRPRGDLGRGLGGERSRGDLYRCRSANADALGASHALSISLHTFAGSRWSQKEIRAAVVDATGLLAQCGVILSRAELCVVEAPRRFHFYSTPVSRDLLRRLPVSKPAVSFVEDTHNRPAYDAEAIGRGNAAARLG